MAQLQATGITGSLTASGNLQINGGNITTAGNDLTLAPHSTNIYLQGKVGITSELTVGAAAAIAGQLLVSGTITTLSPTTVLNISASNSINLAKNTTITGTLSSSGNITTAGNLAANGGIVRTSEPILTLQASSSAPYPPWNYGTVDVYGDTHLYNDLQVDGGNIGTSATRLNLSASNSVNMAKNTTITGTLSSSGNITTAGNLAVNGGNIGTIVAQLNLSASNSINLVKDTRVTGTLTTTGDLFVNGGDATISTTDAKQAVLNLSAPGYGGIINSEGGNKLIFRIEDNPVMALTGSAGSDLTLLAGNLVFGTAGKGIDFSATTSASAVGSVMTSELLDDYEEGTWTPTISGSITAGLYTYDRNGYYTKIGNIVHIHAYINVSTVTTTPTGNLSITGLPFASPSFRSTAVMFTDLRGTTGVTVAQGNIATSVIQIWKNSIASTTLVASDLSPANGLSIVWSLNASYRV